MKKPKKPKRKFPTREQRDYVTIAGSGPSVNGFEGHIDIATKKMSLPADYHFARHAAWYYKVRQESDKYINKADNFILYRFQDTPTHKYPLEGIENRYVCDWRYWDNFFIRKGPKNLSRKPSVGICAFFAAYEVWKPKKVGLIGFDWVLDGHKDWPHDSRCELACMESLAEIVDLREY